MSSIAGLISIPTQGLYAAGKFALEGMSEALGHKLAGFNVKVTLVEPGMYGTGFASRFVEFTEAYQPVRDALMARFADATFGDPAEVAEAVVRLVHSEDPPRRVLLGREAEMIMDAYRKRLDEWQSLAGSALDG
jgi:NAD(P)-dependent dehydrogenase (short-subunit alcohol dehydrogenase family)